MWPVLERGKCPVRALPLDNRQRLFVEIHVIRHGLNLCIERTEVRMLRAAAGCSYAEVPRPRIGHEHLREFGVGFRQLEFCLLPETFHDHRDRSAHDGDPLRALLIH